MTSVYFGAVTDRSNRPQKSRPVAVAEVLEGYLKRAGLARRVGQAQMIPDWPRLVGPQIAAVATPESLTPDGVLFVRGATSPWVNELRLRPPDIMARVNAGRGAGRIT